MNWRKLFPWVLLFSCVDGFISNWMYPARLPLLYKDFLILGIYFLFLHQEHVQRWMAQMVQYYGRGVWFCAGAFILVGILQIFNPLLSGILIGLLGLKVLFLYWFLAILAYAYIDSFKRAESLFKGIVYFSVLINLFGIYQFWMGPEYLVRTFGSGFLGATTLASYDGTATVDTFLRSIGTFSSPGQYSSFLTINAMLCFSLFASGKRLREHVMTSICAVINFLALLATGSRGALVFLILEILVFAVLCANKRRIVVLTFVTGMALYIGFQWLGEGVIARFETLENLEMVRRRTVETTAAHFISVFGRYPLGRGIGAGSTASRHLLGEESSGWEMVENDLSRMQLETGILGVIFFYLFVMMLSLRWIQAWRRSSDAMVSSFSSPLVSCCLVRLWLALFVGGFYTPISLIFFWVLMGIVARFSVLASESSSKVLSLSRVEFKMFPA